jgi:hypothetical protein
VWRKDAAWGEQHTLNTPSSARKSGMPVACEAAAPVITCGERVGAALLTPLEPPRAEEEPGQREGCTSRLEHERKSSTTFSMACTSDSRRRGPERCRCSATASATTAHTLSSSRVPGVSSRPRSPSTDAGVMPAVRLAVTQSEIRGQRSVEELPVASLDDEPLSSTEDAESAAAEHSEGVAPASEDEEEAEPRAAGALELALEAASASAFCFLAALHMPARGGLRGPCHVRLALPCFGSRWGARGS